MNVFSATAARWKRIQNAKAWDMLFDDRRNDSNGKEVNKSERMKSNAIKIIDFIKHKSVHIKFLGNWNRVDLAWTISECWSLDHAFTIKFGRRQKWFRIQVFRWSVRVRRLVDIKCRRWSKKNHFDFYHPRVLHPLVPFDPFTRLQCTNFSLL